MLAQAWKKADSNIRHHNWYADILELEQTSLLLPEKLKEWSEQIELGAGMPSSTPARVVLAPKNGKWYFPDKVDGGWRFQRHKDAKGQQVKQPDLRPLAHLAMRDQVMAVAVMICLADAVESLQGNTDPASYNSTNAARIGVHSYGNRLFCDWSAATSGGQHARFHWGNATTYTQFFKDYQRFLERPGDVCRDALPTMQGQRLFVVKLDLSKFYDCVDQGRLLSHLKLLWQEYQGEFGPFVVNETEADHSSFWSSCTRILSWSWNKEDGRTAGGLKMGLPQGLVASGFFANAYMHKFDRKIAARCGKTINDGLNGMLSLGGRDCSVKLVDYCRYVDDMRLVVSIAEQDAGHVSLESIASGISAWINDALSEYEDGESQLTTKPEKSEAVAWEDFAIQGSASQFMRGLQGQISVSPDPATLLQATGGLDHLLWLADAIDNESGVERNTLALANISLPKVDVREDTIRRFSANRLRQVLRLRRSMADQELSSEDSVANTDVSELRALDHEMETIARKLVACWSRNPSLASVLRCGLDIYPSVEILRPVLEALLSKIRDGGKVGKQGLVAVYILADLFKAASVETGLHRRESYPAGSDIDAYRSELVQVGLALISNANLPWYLHQQIALFFAVVKLPLSIPGRKGQLSQYRKLHSALRYRKPKDSSSDHLTAGLLIMRITGERDKFLVWFGHWLNSLVGKESKALIQQVATVEPELISDLVKASGTYAKKDWLKLTQPYLTGVPASDSSEAVIDWRPGSRSLTQLAAHPENPFVQENALLKLLQALLDLDAAVWDDDLVCIQKISIYCDSWSSIQDPCTKLVASIKSGVTYSPPWGETPNWVQSEMAWAYRLGRILRSAIVGGSDYTSRHYPLREESFDRYRGLNSSWFKRRLGLMPLTSGLGAEPTPISPWLNELIMRMLQWPGLELQGADAFKFESIRTRADLRKLVSERQKVQSSYYGSLSRLPAYLLPVDGSASMDLRKFKVALVQTLLPRDADFCSTNPLIWSQEYRARHRAHVASMCRLITQQLSVSRFVSKRPEKRIAQTLDLIVFPELAIHPDDMWLLRRLSDSTGAVILAGQTFVYHPYLDKPINRAVWLLRQKTSSGRSIAQVYQGKLNGIPWELDHGVAGHRPYQVIVRFTDKNGVSANLTGSVCYDATDLKLAADMRDITDGFVVPALNKDVSTFDAMAGALHFHMYQPILLANTGQYGGSTAQAPFKDRHDRYIAHVHGTNQAAVSIFDLDLTAFKSTKPNAPVKEKKAVPAGFKGRA